MKADQGREDGTLPANAAGTPLVSGPDSDIDQLSWIKVPAGLNDGEDREPLSKQKLKSWVLVLAAKQIPWQTVKQDRNSWELRVPASDYQNACRELRLYEAENRNWPPPPVLPEHFENTSVTIWVMILLAVFHNITLHQGNLFGHAPLDWYGAGNADAQKILAGQWWRIFTALTLHGGTLHLVGNIVAGGIIIARLANLLRSGPAWFLVIISGGLGNLVNALAHGTNHSSIGFSTAVFAALAILATSTMMLRRRELWRRWPLPLAAGCGLLALLGTSGEQTDLGAHLFGFIMGIVSAAIVFRFRRTSFTENRVNLALALLTISIMAGSWWLALSN